LKGFGCQPYGKDEISLDLWKERLKINSMAIGIFLEAKNN